jgi:hypothetical protein
MAIRGATTTSSVIPDYVCFQDPEKLINGRHAAHMRHSATVISDIGSAPPTRQAHLFTS